MTIETYIPSEVHYADGVIGDVFAVTLHDPDSDGPHGSMTTSQPLAESERGGPLVVLGTRDGQRWRIALPEIEVCRSTALGFEYTIFGRVERTRLGASRE